MPYRLLRVTRRSEPRSLLAGAQAHIRHAGGCLSARRESPAYRCDKMPQAAICRVWVGAAASTIRSAEQVRSVPVRSAHRQETVMPVSKAVKKVLHVVAAALLAVGSTAFAHTTIRSQATEGVTDDNALKIGHTCETPDGDHIPIIAQSVVFPTMSPEITS